MLWAFIPGKHIEAVGALPQSARRLDTGEMIIDLRANNAMWARACGWWDLDNINVPLLVDTNNLTQAELNTLAAERDAAIAGRQARRFWVEDVTTAWANARTLLVDHLDSPPTPTPPAPSDSVNAIIYLYNRVQQLTQVIAGGASINDVGIGDALKAVMEVLLEQIEERDDLDI